MNGMRVLRALLWIILIVVGLGMLAQNSRFIRHIGSTKPMDYSELVRRIEKGDVESLTITNGTARVELKKAAPGNQWTWTTVLPEPPADQEFYKLARQNVKSVNIVRSMWPGMLSTFISILLPMLLIIGLYLFIMRQNAMSGNQALNFGRSRAKRLADNMPKVTFDDVAGVDEAKQELEEVVEFLKHPEKFQALGAKIPKGVLLLGPPGCGKTLLARAIAGEAGVPFFHISGSDFVEMFVGVGASVTGDTPILVKTDEGARLTNIGEFVDAHYAGDAEGYVVRVEGVQTLGFAEKESKFKGSPKQFFGRSEWVNMRGVYRHRVKEIYEIHYLGGVLRTTGDHSVFVRTRDGVHPKAARDLKPGDVLVDLLGATWDNIDRETGGLKFTSGLPEQERKPVVRAVIVKPYNGYVYDLCGCDNEAFFGGEKPLLLHNSRVRDLFDQAKAHRPCLIFIDEIDAVGRQRGAGLGGGHDEREQTLNQLLVEMDGFDPNIGIILIAATNRPDVLDPALLRPGRFDRRVVVDNPDMNGRKAILQVHTKGKPLAEGEVDLDLLARRTPGFSGADLANLVNEAALLAARRGKTQISMQEFEESIERVIAGPERKSRVISEKEKKIIAYHEVGHALIAKLLPNVHPVHKVTIIPRGMALGYTLQLPSEDSFLTTRSELLDEVTVLLGGRVAEELVFQEIATGAQNDLERATEIARRMVCEWGMSENVGPMTLGRRHGPVFLGRDLVEDRNYSEEVAAAIDKEVRSIIDTCYARARTLLDENRGTLEKIVERLLVRETLEAEELDRLMSGEPEPTPETPDPEGGTPAVPSAPADEPRRAPAPTRAPKPVLAGA